MGLGVRLCGGESQGHQVMVLWRFPLRVGLRHSSARPEGSSLDSTWGARCGSGGGAVGNLWWGGPRHGTRWWGRTIDPHSDLCIHLRPIDHTNTSATPSRETLPSHTPNPPARATTGKKNHPPLGFPTERRAKSTKQVRAATQPPPDGKHHRKTSNQPTHPFLSPSHPITNRTTISKMADSDAPVTLRTRKFIRNPLLGRKQMVV